jgi:hypothetical protein
MAAEAAIGGKSGGGLRRCGGGGGVLVAETAPPALALLVAAAGALALAAGFASLCHAAHGRRWKHPGGSSLRPLVFDGEC